MRRNRGFWKGERGAALPIVLAVPATIVGYRSLTGIGPDQSMREFLASVGVMAAALAIDGLLLAAVRCPHCGSRLLGRAIWHSDGLAALTTLLKSPVCVECSYDPRRA